MIEVVVPVMVYDDGTEWPKHYDVEWDDKDDCSCKECEFEGKVLYFQIDYQDMPEWPSQKDKELVGYCSLHHYTDRALFSGKDVHRMLELAGDVAVVPPSRHGEFFSMHSEMGELCSKARKRFRNPIKGAQ